MKVVSISFVLVRLNHQNFQFQVGWVFSQENYLSQKTLQTISQMKHQFVEQLSSIGFVSGTCSTRDLDRAARGKGGADAVALVTGRDERDLN